MSQPALETPAPPARPPVEYSASSSAGAHRSRGRMVAVTMILISFIATALLQHVAQVKHHDMVKDSGSEANLGNLNSFSLGLLLGGLRGPLVMMLWTSSESQKQEKDLEDFDSKIELIRLLQPEFISVHLFQMWNKAYNISVQMANKPNKYATILDAIEYGYKVNQQLHNNVNIISEIGHLYFNKLGESQEKDYYTERVRRETFPDVKITVPADRVAMLETLLAKAGVESAKRDVMISHATRNGWFVTSKPASDLMRPLLSGPGVSYSALQPTVFSDTGRRVRVDPMLDLDGNILPALLAGQPRPADLPADKEWNDGSELQYLAKFQPFTYGIPPMGIGWNYIKRCQVLKDATHQKHVQVSDSVVDSRPAINLKIWGESEWNQGRQAEMRAFGLKPPVAENTGVQRAMIENPASDIPPTAAFTDLAAAREALYHYDMVVRIAEEGIKEFNRHDKQYAGADSESNREPVIAMRALCVADADYLRAMLLPQGDNARRQPLLKKASLEYEAAALAWEVLMLKHQVQPRVAAMIPGLSGPTGEISIDLIDSMAPARVHQLAKEVVQFLAAHSDIDMDSDRHDTERYFLRAYHRLMQLHGGSPT